MRNAAVSFAQKQTTCVWVNLRNASAHTRPTTERSPFTSRFGPAPFTSFYSLHLLECIVLVITVMVVILLLSLLLLFLLCCCLLRTLVSSRLFPFLVVYLRLSHVSFSLCTRKSSSFVSHLASCTPAPPCTSSSLDLSSLVWGRKSPRRIFSPTLPHPRGDLRASCEGSLKGRSIHRISRIDPSRSTEDRLDPRNRNVRSYDRYPSDRSWRRRTLFSREQSEE